MVAAALVGIGHEVLVAADASEAMRLTDRVHLGLIILDLNLAGENGLTRMIYLRHNQPGVPVILRTGREHDEAAVVAMRQAGANHQPSCWTNAVQTFPFRRQTSTTMSRHTFDPGEAKSIRLRITATNGADAARVYEVRCYA